MFERRKIDGIIFDLGNVLLPTEPNKRKVARYWARFSKLDEIELANILYHGTIIQDRRDDPRVLKFWEWVSQFDNGDFSSYEMYCVMKNLLMMDINFAQFAHSWELIVEPDAYFIDFLYELQYLRLGIISNLCDIHLHYIRRRGFLPRWLFCCCLYSCVEGCSKPGTTIFLRGIKGMNLPAERILFVDDLKPNIEAAESVGMKAYHYDIHDGSDQKQRLKKFKEYLRKLRVIR